QTRPTVRPLHSFPTRRSSDLDPLPPGSAVLGDPAAIALRDAAVEPGVVFDVRNGPVVLESGAEVRAGARLEGPLWVGANAHVLGDRKSTRLNSSHLGISYAVF